MSDQEVSISEGQQRDGGEKEVVSSAAIYFFHNVPFNSSPFVNSNQISHSEKLVWKETEEIYDFLWGPLHPKDGPWSYTAHSPTLAV